MKVKELCQELGWEKVCGDGENEIKGGIYCCDLLSIVMGRAPAGSLWVTVMGNVNAMAVSSLADTACVVLAENMRLDKEAVEGAKKENITVLCSGKPVFETAAEAAKLLGLI